MTKLLLGLAVLACATTPALANECPLLKEQIAAKTGNRFDAGAANAKGLAAEAWVLHEAGKHDASVAKFDEAAKAAGIELMHKK